MTDVDRAGGVPGRPGRRLRRVEHHVAAGVVAAALAIALTGTGLVATATPEERAVAVASLAGSAPAHAVTDGDGLIGAQVPERPTSFAFPPRRLVIPGIGVDAPVSATGLLADRTLEVPEDTDLVGWYDGFASPGDPGVSVLLGHVDSRTGPGVFVRLPELAPGDRVQVERHDRRVVTYEVTAVDWYAKDGFPTTRVFTDDRDEVLRIITCGGTFDRAARTYLENVVVTAVPVTGAPPDAAA